VDDHRTLLELAQRGEQAAGKARERLHTMPLVRYALAAPNLNPGQMMTFPDPANVRVLVRAAPLTVTPQLTEWPILADGGAHACFVAAEALLPSSSGPARVEPAARGAIARKASRKDGWIEQPWTVTTVADSGGVVGASLTWPAEAFDHVLETHQLRGELIRPTLNATVQMLSAAEAYGRVALDAFICLPGDIHVQDSPKPARPAESVHEIYVAGELTIPVGEDEVHALGLSWEREFARTFALERWEDDSE
jgi:hypothetical protein